MKLKWTVHGGLSKRMRLPSEEFHRAYFKTYAAASRVFGALSRDENVRWVIEYRSSAGYRLEWWT